MIRRLDCVLEPTKQAVLKRHGQISERIENVEPLLQAVASQQFFNTSPLTFTKLLDDPDTIADALSLYIGGFFEAARDIIDKFDFPVQLERLRKANLLYQVVGRFADIDLHPEAVSNIEMGYLYEELIRKFSELSNETAGEHFTPREVIRLMINLLFIDDADDILTKPGVVKTLCDPACGTGGMLSVAEDHLRALNPQARLEVFGQELNAETYAVCRSDMMLKGQDASHIAFGNSFSEDHHEGARFDYLLANPPFGVEWKKVEDEVRDEARTRGFDGRFGAGLPRINDGSFLFLQHMISKMKRPEEGGSRVAIVFNGSPLFTGAAGSGESDSELRDNENVPFASGARVICGGPDRPLRHFPSRTVEDYTREEVLPYVPDAWLIADREPNLSTCRVVVTTAASTGMCRSIYLVVTYPRPARSSHYAPSRKAFPCQQRYQG